MDRRMLKIGQERFLADSDEELLKGMDGISGESFENKILIDENGDKSIVFNDFRIKGIFEYGKNYYCSFNVSTIIEKAMSFTVYLKNRDSEGKELASQIIKRIKVIPSILEDSLAKIIIYADAENKDVLLWKNWNENKNKIFKVGDEHIEIKGDGDWPQQESGDKKHIIKEDVINCLSGHEQYDKNISFIFSPMQNMQDGGRWNAIEIVQTRSIDDFISSNKDEIKIDKSSIAIYELKQAAGTVGKKIYHLGVWGRSDLPMCINGDEVKIGPNEYYEYESDEVPITSICVATLDEEDSYIMNYEYYEEKSSGN